jgi:hypothetical protein
MRTRDSLAARINSWWDAVLAGRKDVPHPVYGTAVSVHLKDRHLRLAGVMESRKDLKELVHQARERIGDGIHDIDASHLTVVDQTEKPGILDQVLIAAFDSREVAELARKYVLERSRVVPKREEIVDPEHAGNLGKVVPADFVPDVQRALEAGRAVLVLQVDETEVFDVRELLEEDTRNLWTVAAPPRVSGASA